MRSRKTRIILVVRAIEVSQAACNLPWAGLPVYYQGFLIIFLLLVVQDTLKVFAKVRFMNFTCSKFLPKLGFAVNF